MVEEARGYDRAAEGRGCEGRVGYTRRLGRRRKGSGAEGCRVERSDAILVYGRGGVRRFTEITGITEITTEITIELLKSGLMVYIIPKFIIISYISIFVCRFCNKTDKYITFTHSHTNTEITDQSITSTTDTGNFRL